MIKTINLKPTKERSLLNYHPWVFSGAVGSQVNDIADGDVVDVMSFDGRFLARGHFTKGSIMVRILSFQQEPLNVDFFTRKFKTALEVRMSAGLPSSTTDAYRLIHGEGDGLPGLVIDVYGSCAVVQSHTAGMSASISMICEALLAMQGQSFKTIYYKSAESGGTKQSNEASDKWLLGTDAAGEVIENGHRFYIDWVTGQKTGFFLDQRENRNLMGRYAKGKRVLNTFCYSGGFSVYALAAGATHVDSVDSSARAIEWTNKNVALNSNGNSSHVAHVADVFDFLKSNGSDYDMMVLDPPAFAKRLHAVDQAIIGYRNLNHEAISRIKPGGLLFTFSCSQAVDALLFRKTVFTAAAKARRQVRVLHQMTQGPDHPVSLYHPEGEYLKGLVLSIE